MTKPSMLATVLFMFCMPTFVQAQQDAGQSGGAGGGAMAALGPVLPLLIDLLKKSKK